MEEIPIKKKRSTSKTNTTGVKVRMYCHGFGDCFLLTFLEKDKPVYRMLIDCGMLTGKAEQMEKAVLNIKETCNSHLNLVVQTHEHKDHVSGFNIKDGTKLLWDTIRVDNVWLAWTENTGTNGDELAKQLKRKQRKKTVALAKAIGLYKKAIKSDEHVSTLSAEYRGREYLAAQERYAIALEQILAFFDIGINEDGDPLKNALPLELNGDSLNLGLTIENAMNYFLERAGNRNLPDKMRPDVTFWNPGDLADARQTGLEGINFYFFGPPKNYNQLKLMEDKSHVEMYVTEMGLADNFYLALDSTDTEEDYELSPFNPKYFLDVNEVFDDRLCNDDNEKDDVRQLYHCPEHKWRKIDIDWLHNTGALALHLDSYTNNTSLAFAIEFEESGKVLLFPGDAQIGSWISWTQMEDEDSKEPKLKWAVNKNGSKERVTVEKLLNRTVFYKVGHHASHNATAKKHGLELMTNKDLVAMIPVDEEVAKKQGKKGWLMPARDLYTRLKQKTKGRIIRLDTGNILQVKDEDFPEGGRASRKEAALFSKRITKSETTIQIDENKSRPLYYEYIIDGK